MKKRNNFLDILKGLAIILVIVGHNIQFGSGELYFSNQSYFNNIIFKIIYSFHMPVFILISGYLFYNSTKKYSDFDLFKSKLHSLILPIFCWSIIPILILVLKVCFGKVDFDIGILFSFIRIILTNLWFLWAVLFCSICVIFNKHFFHDSKLFYFLIFVLCFITPDFLNLSLYKFMYPYFILGYLSNKYQFLTRFKSLLYSKKNQVLFIITSFIIYLFLLTKYDNNSYIYTSGISIFGDFGFSILKIDFYRWLIGFVGSFLIIVFVYMCYSFFNKNNICFRTLIYCGQNSLGIYIINSLINQYVLLRILKNTNYNFIYILLETIIVLMVCIILNKLLKSNKITKKYLLGMK